MTKYQTAFYIKNQGGRYIINEYAVIETVKKSLLGDFLLQDFEIKVIGIKEILTSDKENSNVSVETINLIPLYGHHGKMLLGTMLILITDLT